VWDEVVRIDGMVKFMLEMFAVPYIPLESLSMQERVRTVERVLSLAGVGRERAPATREVTPRERPASGNGNGNGSRAAAANGH
jgi:hypothetical protein